MTAPREGSLLQRGRPRPAQPLPYSLTPLGSVPLPPAWREGLPGLAAWERARSLLWGPQSAAHPRVPPGSSGKGERAVGKVGKAAGSPGGQR